MNSNHLPKIFVKNESEAIELCKNEPNKWNVISIYWGAPALLEQAKDVLRLKFKDIDSPYDGCCTDDHIKAALNFARNKVGEPIIVHCAAGVSRSAAIALILLIDHLKNISEFPIDDAVEYLHRTCPWVMPNRFILAIGLPYVALNERLEINWWKTLYNNKTFRGFYGA